MREKNFLMQEKAILLEELQHRIANSLQVVASVLLQSARTARSDEARTHITDAHHRVMSVVALQHQLVLSHTNEVDLGPYLTTLCRSIGDSMIRNTSMLAIEVRVGTSLVAANMSLSVGLIVTELVINALKHAFPDQRMGKIGGLFASCWMGMRWVTVASEVPTLVEAASFISRTRRSARGDGRLVGFNKW